jgi:hypothetical protein
MTYSTPRLALLAQRLALVDAIEKLERHLVNVEHAIDLPNVGWGEVGEAAMIVDAIKRAELV